MAVKNPMTIDFLRSAYGGESMAHMRYLLWGEVARKEGFPNIAKLFEAIAYAELVHARNHFTVLDGDVTDHPVTAGGVFGNKETAENLTGAIMGEDFEIDQMYPVYLETARFQGEKDAVRSFTYALEAEKLHSKLFSKAQNAARSGKDMEFKDVYVCPVCGHTILNDAPDKCPVCGLAKEKYLKF
ncbi:MAG: rubrerythrin family protein [Aminobacterium sp.]|jgi:rubrerythrin|uniref:rubrerythrin family protein n=1 Tax=Aminobacterium sp. TaxID=1872491 RepID=UPI001BCEC7C1|nr:ferritin family protein [Aminobacterium sp.]MDD2205873.1 rubrerythrin family protein [Aminobacterium sp.]MDD3426302.1 rubrerythrin family protein [Aminobacterium sp.]MDD3706678.1 rubrerythrin family protein [Aminobacterium sp.]MDD4228112.1 rubrerythrin family protein [Aminobacterium sp.]MDD4550857.1 rubrerythrin family protein [Aminobacterium sp.]